jgi:hypothetical protein
MLKAIEKQQAEMDILLQSQVFLAEEFLRDR